MNIPHRSQKPIVKGYLLVFSEETVNFLRPLLRRAANTRRPLAEFIRSRNPCLFFLRRLDGWYVLFIIIAFLFQKQVGKGNILIQFQKRKINFF